MILSEPIPFADAMRSRKVRALMPTTLSSEELSQIDSALLRRAMFSARTTNAYYLGQVSKKVAAILNPVSIEGRTEGLDYPTARLELRQLLESLGYQAPEGKEAGIEDLSSDARLNLVLKTNVEMAQGYGNYRAGMGVLDDYPAQEFIRAEERKEPRDWPERWEEAGGEFIDGDGPYPEGRMIALKTSPIWAAISAFDQPWPPFDFNSGMDVQDIGYEEAVELGVIREGEKQIPTEDELNDGLEVNAEELEPSLAQALLESLGAGYELAGGVLRMVNETGNGSANSFEGHAGRPGEVGGSLPSGVVKEEHVALEKVQVSETGKDGKPIVRTKFVMAGGAPLPEHLAKVYIPPGWTDVKGNPDPAGALLVKGTDSKGRQQSIYSDEHDMQAAAAKFARVNELLGKQESIRAQIAAGKNGLEREEAAALALIQHTGIRPGSETETGGAVVAYGATTLEGRHVTIKGDNVTLDFVGKKGVTQSISVTDPAIKSDLIARAKKAGPDGKLFATDDSRLRNYSKSLDGGGFKPKDFRTAVGTSTAMKEVAALPTPSSTSAYKKAVLGVAKTVAAKLGNTPGVALQKYINPTVFAVWR